LVDEHDEIAENFPGSPKINLGHRLFTGLAGGVTPEF